MPKRSTARDIPLLIFSLIVLLNSLWLRVNNELLPWIYLLTTLVYFFLHCELTKKNLISISGATLSILQKPLALMLIIFLPVLIPLYYFNFTLSFTAVVVNGLLTYLLYKTK